MPLRNQFTMYNGRKAFFCDSNANEFKLSFITPISKSFIHFFLTLSNKQVGAGSDADILGVEPDFNTYDYVTPVTYLNEFPTHV